MSLTPYKKNQKHHLNHTFWKADKTLRPEVRNQLKKIAMFWASNSKIPVTAIKDIVLTGGNASYFYNDKSDLDVHLIVDKSKISECEGLLDDYLRTQQTLWRLEHDVKVYDSPVEVYAEDIDDKTPPGQPRYSLKKDKWIQEPSESQTPVVTREIKAKVTDMQNYVNDLIQNGANPTILKAYKEKIQKLRQIAVREGGEKSFDNLAYKLFRNSGYLNKIDSYVRSNTDEMLSLKKKMSEEFVKQLESL